MAESPELIIRPEDNDFVTILAAGWYKDFWEKNQQKIIAAFKQVTGLEFQQQEILVDVRPGSFATAGTADNPMVLPADHMLDIEKTVTLMHELGHRLLGGNALSPIGLGLIKDVATIDLASFQLFEHKHLYLFLYDVIHEAYGQTYAQACEKYALATTESSYTEAWHWAMSLDRATRRHGVEVLASQALTRDRWHERDDVTVPLRDVTAWFKSLVEK